MRSFFLSRQEFPSQVMPVSELTSVSTLYRGPAEYRRDMEHVESIVDHRDRSAENEWAKDFT